MEALGVGVVVGVAVAVAVSVASSNSTLCDTDGEAAISQYGGSTYDHTPVSRLHTLFVGYPSYPARHVNSTMPGNMELSKNSP